MDFTLDNSMLETANRVRRTVAASARLRPELTSEAAVGTVVGLLAQRLTSGEAHALLAALPVALRPMVEVGVLLREGTPTLRIDRAEFLRRVADDLDVTPAHAELVCAAVFTALRVELPSPLVANVASQLPHGLKELWLSQPIVAADLDVAIRPQETRDEVERQLARRGALPPGIEPSHAFAAVMGTLASRLSAGEVRHLVLGLPGGLRALVETGGPSRREEPAVFGEATFLRAIGEHFSIDEPTARHLAAEVFHVVRRVLPQQVLGEIASQLPDGLRALWEAH